LEEEKRRETWEETVKRYCDFMKKIHEDNITTREYNEVYNAIYNLEVMPSMRALWSAGKAAEVDNFAIYNCTFTTIECLKDFAEILYILMNGCGVGFSVERQFIEKLPTVAEELNILLEKKKIIFADSKRGWAEGFLEVLNCLWKGIPYECDYSKLRPRGARLKTFGGTSSGPEPLMNLISYTDRIISENRGKKLQSIRVHDICCKVADVVVSGGVRRSACISLSDLDDMEMSNAKSGKFQELYPHRQLSNNSVAYTRTPDMISFLDEWKNLYMSKSGERGIFNRNAAIIKASENQRRDETKIVGINPCGEILLRKKGVCNLSEVVVRPEDDFKSLKKKIKIAAMIGTWQSALTNFNFVSNEWKKNAEEERLLGVSLTGVRDHSILGTINDTAKKWLADFKHIAIASNKKIAEKLGIDEATAITAVKPSGTVSQLVDCAPGAHVRQTETGYYTRRVRISATDALFKLLKDKGVPYECEVGQIEENCNTYVLEFPMKAPKGAKTRKGQTAQEQLQFWQMYKEFWCEHNPSVTISVAKEEWLDTAAWVYKNFNCVGGLTFMPKDDYVYQLPPYEDIDKETYNLLIKTFPEIDFLELISYENEDNTEGAKELACVGDNCSIN
jgi:ribonucleoside-diphosphate reductase alpha chain